MHANQMIEYHMQEILDRQRVIDKYKTMAGGAQDIIALESEQ